MEDIKPLTPTQIINVLWTIKQTLELYEEWFRLYREQLIFLTEQIVIARGEAAISPKTARQQRIQEEKMDAIQGEVNYTRQKLLDHIQASISKDKYKYK